jgi:hypothetical protein
MASGSQRIGRIVAPDCAGNKPAVRSRFYLTPCSQFQGRLIEFDIACRSKGFHCASNFGQHCHYRVIPEQPRFSGFDRHHRRDDHFSVRSFAARGLLCVPFATPPMQ